VKNQYIAEIEINYKPKSLSGLLKISNSNDTYLYLKKVWSKHINYKEEFYLICLNRANKVLGYSVISVGGISGCVVDPRIIFQTALKANASAIIIAHNHPSGNLKPSDQDIKITKNISKAGVILQQPLLDHLIITDDGYFSFGDEGLLSKDY